MQASARTGPTFPRLRCASVPVHAAAGCGRAQSRPPRKKGDGVRAVLSAWSPRRDGEFVLGAFWLTWQASQYSELGDYLIRVGLSWLFLTFLSFLAFSAVVASLSTFFLSDDLRLILAAPIASRRLFLARFARTVAQSGWLVVVFLLPVLAGMPSPNTRRGSSSHRGYDGGRSDIQVALARGDAALFDVFPPARARHPDADGPDFAMSTWCCCDSSADI